MRNRKHDGNKSSVVNFGVQGWVTILYCLLMFWLYAGMEIGRASCRERV